MVSHGTTGSGFTEVHVVDGSHGFDYFLAHTVTALRPSGAAAGTVYSLADQNADGSLDLYAISRTATGSGHTEVHTLSGVDGFQSFLVHDATFLPETGADGNFDFVTADANADGAPDLYVMVRAHTASGFVELEILSGADHFQTVLFHEPTALTSMGSDPSWQLAVLRPISIDAHYTGGLQNKAIVKRGGQNGGGYASALSYVPGNLNDPNSADILVTADGQGDVFQIDPSTGTSTKIGSYGTAVAGKVISSGDLIGVRGVPARSLWASRARHLRDRQCRDATERLSGERRPGELRKATPIGTGTGFKHIFGLGFWAGTIYGFVDNGAGSGKVITINPNTGVGTQIDTGAIEWFGAGVSTDAPILQ